MSCAENTHRHTEAPCSCQSYTWVFEGDKTPQRAFHVVQGSQQGVRIGCPLQSRCRARASEGWRVCRPCQLLLRRRILRIRQMSSLKVGAGMLEPWRRDAGGTACRRRAWQRWLLRYMMLLHLSQAAGSISCFIPAALDASHSRRLMLGRVLQQLRHARLPCERGRLVAAEHLGCVRRRQQHSGGVLRGSCWHDRRREAVPEALP